MNILAHIQYLDNKKVSISKEFTLLPYLSVDLIKQGEQKGVEVPQEEGEDAPKLPLQSDPRMVILKLGDRLKQRRTHQTEQRHDDLQLFKTVQINALSLGTRLRMYLFFLTRINLLTPINSGVLLLDFCHF